MKPDYTAGEHYVAISGPRRILMPDLPALRSLRHRWCWEKRLRPHVPVWSFARVLRSTFSPEENARDFKALLAGTPSAYRDAVLLNAAAALESSFCINSNAFRYSEIYFALLSPTGSKASTASVLPLSTRIPIGRGYCGTVCQILGYPRPAIKPGTVFS